MNISLGKEKKMNATDLFDAFAEIDEKYTADQPLPRVTGTPRAARVPALRAATVAVLCIFAALAVGLASASVTGILPEGFPSWISGGGRSMREEVGKGLNAETEDPGSISGDRITEDYYTCKYLEKNEYKEYLTDVLGKKGAYVFDSETRRWKKETTVPSKTFDKVGDCTPPAVADNSDIRLYMADYAYYLAVGNEIYSIGVTGGYFKRMCLWDYDGDGTNDLVAYYGWGYGVDGLALSVIDLNTMEQKNVMITANEIPYFKFGFDGKNIYVDGEPVNYRDGEFVIG